MVKRFTLALLHTIRNDFVWLNSFEPAVKVVGMIFGIALIFAAWCLGLEWWTKVVIFVLSGMAREAPRYEIASVFLAAIVLTYLVSVIERARNDFR